MLSFELTGESFEHAPGSCSIRAAVRGRDRASDALLHLLGQVILDVASLVHPASLDQCACTEDSPDRLAECLAAVDDEEHRAVGPDAACSHVVKQRGANGRVLRG